LLLFTKYWHKNEMENTGSNGKINKVGDVRRSNTSDMSVFIFCRSEFKLFLRKTLN